MHEGALHSHTRKALETGYTREEIRQVAIIATLTIAFPSAMAALSWVVKHKRPGSRSEYFADVDHDAVEGCPQSVR